MRNIVYTFRFRIAHFYIFVWNFKTNQKKYKTQTLSKRDDDPHHISRSREISLLVNIISGLFDRSSIAHPRLKNNVQIIQLVMLNIKKSNEKQRNHKTGLFL